MIEGFSRASLGVVLAIIGIAMVVFVLFKLSNIDYKYFVVGIFGSLLATLGLSLFIRRSQRKE